MQKPPFAALAINKLASFNEKIRIAYLKMLGLTIGKRCRLGKIICQWPHKIAIGDHCNIEEGVSFWLMNPFNPENHIKIGKSVFIGRNCEFNCTDKILVGDNCLIASKTVLADSGHPFQKDKLIGQQGTVAEMIRIENDVWIGTCSTILRGVTLGAGCIVGAHSLVNKSIPPYEIWGGVPARKIGERT